MTENLEYNRAPSCTMHVDLNSCFATIEQQSRPRLRGRPVVVMNRKSTNAAIVTASYEAKRQGVVTGMRLEEVRRLVPGVIAVETDPPKYHFVYQKLMAILKSYSPQVEMKSIDEGIIDFSNTRTTINTRSLSDIGFEIKARLKSEVGNYMTCNVGIGPNRFLAKTAAGLNKPDGLDDIDHTNLRRIFAGLKLTDLTGIASRNQARLNAVGIMTPLEFLDSREETLGRLVFKGKPGRDWYKRLRGYEVDATPTRLGVVGRQYVLEVRGLSRQQILQRLHFLSQSTGTKLRLKNKQARGVAMYARTFDHGRWKAHQLFLEPISSSQTIYETVRHLFKNAPAADRIREVGVLCYHLSGLSESQPKLWDIPFDHQQKIDQTVDTINSYYGSSAIQPADMVGLDRHMKQKIPFGSTRYFEMLGVIE